jgi:hypothetical protein
VLALVAVAALVAVGLVARATLGDDGPDADAIGEPPGTATSTTTTEAAPRPTATLPSTTTTAPPVRRAPEVPLPAGNGPHLYIATEADGDPVTWDPCDPVRFVVNSRLAPPGAPEILAEAMARVSAATGLVFADAGPSDEPPPVGPTRPLRDPARYGEGWSPVLISWTDQTEVPALTEFDGFAWVQWVPAEAGEAIHVSGNVELDVRDVAEMLSRGDREQVVALVMHELGHLVGLAHVPDTTEVMTDDPGGIVALDWGTGDRYGLAALGHGECDPAV